MIYEYAEESRISMGVLFGAILRKFPRILIVTLLLLGGTYFFLSTIPRQYQSTASILVEPRQSIFTRAANEISPSGNSSDPSIVSSHVELIKSRDNLIRVIEKEGLLDVAEFNGSKRSFLGSIFSLLSSAEQNQSPEQRVLLALDERLKVIQLRQSRVITIYFRSTDPVLASKIANSIAKMYVLRRSELSFTDTAEATSWLAKEVDIMRQSVTKAEAKVAKYRIDNDLFSGLNNSSLLDQQVTLLSTQISQAQERTNSAQTRVELIRALLKEGRSIEGVTGVRDSAVIQRLTQDKARLQGERAQLLATLLPNHPNIQAISAQLGELNKQIRSEGLQVAAALESEAQIQAKLENSLRDELTRLKMQVSGATKNSVMLNELEREATAQRDLLATYLLRFRDASARSDATSIVPDVRVVSVAAPSIQPVSPKVSFVLLAVALVSFTLQLGQVLTTEVLSGRAIKQVRSAVAQNKYYAPTMPNNASEHQTVSPEPVNPEPVNSVVEKPKDNEDKKLLNLVTNIDDLNYQILTSRKQVVLVASAGGYSDEIIKSISASIISKGESVVEIDAGSHKTTSHLGLSDISEGNVGFGDVIQRQAKTNFAIVPWGRKGKINYQSKNCEILVGALGELFNNIIIDVGNAGVASAMPAFTNFDASVVIVVNNDTDYASVKAIKSDIYKLGLSNIFVVSSDENRTKVA